MINPIKSIQTKFVNKSIRLVKMGKIKEAEKAIKPAVNYLIRIKCKMCKSVNMGYVGCICRVN